MHTFQVTRNQRGELEAQTRIPLDGGRRQLAKGPCRIVIET